MTNENKKTLRRLDLVRGTLVLTLILYIVVALIMNSSYLTLDRLMRLRSDVVAALRNEGDSLLPLEADDTVDVVLFQDGYAVLTRNGLSVRSADGVEYSSHVLRYKNPCIRASGKYLLCFDRGSEQWSLFNSFRLLCEGTEAGDIINASVTDDGYVSVASERDEAKGSVTVYNIDGLDLIRWNSEHYLLDSFFIGKNRLAVISVASDKEKTNTVYTVFNYKNGEILTSIASPDTFPLAMQGKQDGTVELLTATGAISFNGETAALVYPYPEPSPGIFRQGNDATMISYQTISGSVLVQAFAASGQVLFSAEYPAVLSLACANDRYFVLTPSALYVLDSAGNLLLQKEASASEILTSAEISLLVGPSFAETLDLSSLP